MKSLIKSGKVFAICFLLVFVVSCTQTFRGPDHFAEINEVYGNALLGNLPVSAPSDSRLKVVYAAPYEDVFRAAEVSVAQAQLFVEYTNKDKGIILATRSTKVGSHINNYIEPTMNSSGYLDSEKRYYLIHVNELAAESAAVIIFTKIQFECHGQSGIVSNVKECMEKTKVHWPSGKEKNREPMEMFHNLLRNNLIASGVL